MRGAFSGFLALGFVFLASAPSPAQFRGGRERDPEAARYGWLATLEEGKAQARTSGRPLLVVLRCVP
jgi:hypothetical protein